ncbi:MAG: tyrosine-type recombinase/integrase, partial [Terriglobia bacterium]
TDQLDRFGIIVKLLILTGQRRGEIAGIKPQCISDKAITWPKETTKNGREHTLPISNSVKQLLPHLPQNYNTWAKPKVSLDHLSQVHDWTLHDLRRTYATNMAALGTPIHVIEKLLNHSSGTIRGVAAIYNRHSYFEEMKIADAAYEEKLQSLFAG